MMRVYVIRGGVSGWGGVVDSFGMDSLRSEIDVLPGISASIHDWSEYATIASLARALPQDTRIAVVGYSGGGWRAASVCNLIRPREVELIVALDPSPWWWMQITPIRSNVKRAICFYNLNRLSGQLGGGLLRSLGGPKIERRTINRFHLGVQFDEAVRAGTVAAIREAVAHA